MNKIKEAYKCVIVDFIIENYIELNNEINASQGMMPENVLNEKFSALKFMKNLIKTITAESDEEVQERIEEKFKELTKSSRKSILKRR